MNLKEIGGKIVDKIKGKVNEIRQDAEDMKELQKWQTILEEDRSAYNEVLELMDEREAIYLGTHDVDGNRNDDTTPAKGRKKSNNVRNIVYEFIESEVDNTNPQPMVKELSRDNVWKAKQIEDSLKADLKNLKIQRLNDLQERTCPIQGVSFFEVYWDNNVKTHTTVGDLKIRLIHPKHIVPQIGVWDLDLMDHFAIQTPVTKHYIFARYGKDVDGEQEEHPELNSISLNDVPSNVMTGYANADSESSNVTENVIWYVDEDGDYGRFVFVNNIVCENLPKYFYRRDDKGNIMEFETITEDIIINAPKSNKPQPQNAPQGPEASMGNPNVSLKPEGQTIIPAGSKVPYFVPDCCPIIARENVPISFAFGGQSDVDVVRDQSDAIKKVTSKLQEKILKGGSVITLPESQRGKFKLNDDELKVAYVAHNEAGLINVYSMQPDISKDMAFLEEQYKSAQSTLGITDSFQGKRDSTATSGYAKKLQIDQSGGRMKSKQQNKYQAYADMFKVMFYFKLAYQDEPRPYVTKDADGNPSYEEFNRYNFLKMDKAGEWYYDTSYLFMADASGGIPEDRMFMLEMTQNLYKEGGLTKLQLWQILETLHYPLAGDIKKQIENASNQPPSAVPNISISFKDLPQDAQKQVLKLIGIETQGGMSIPDQIAKGELMLKNKELDLEVQLKNKEIDTKASETKGDDKKEEVKVNPKHLIDGLSAEEKAHLQQNPDHVLERIPGGKL